MPWADLRVELVQGHGLVPHSSLTLHPLHDTFALHLEINKKMLLCGSDQVPFVAIGQTLRSTGGLSRAGSIGRVDPLWDPARGQGRSGPLAGYGITEHSYHGAWGWEKQTTSSGEDFICLLASYFVLSQGRNQLPAHALHPLPCRAHWDGFPIDNLCKKCHLNITKSTPRKAKTCVANQFQSLEGSSSWLGQTQLSRLRTKGWETMIDMLVLFILVPLLLMPA